jgi:hypothetical protein
VYVIATTDDRALELARESFRRDDDDHPNRYENLSAAVLCALDGGEVVSKPSDCGWEAQEANE